MKRTTRRIKTDLAVIGTGMAGFAASVFARARGLEVAQVGHSGAIAYTTGYLDLLGAIEGVAWGDPWAALAELRRDAPEHPLARVPDDDIRAAFGAFTDALGEMGLGYTTPGDRNLNALLPYGGRKPTYSVPLTMLPGIEAADAKAPALIVDFEGLQGFSAREFAINSADAWPGLRTVRLTFPGMENRQVFPEVMARSLETRAGQEAFAALIREHLGEERYVGLPAILGMQAPDKVRAALEDRIGARLFEIPTMPPAVPGIRLRELFERGLPALGVQLEPQLKASAVSLGTDTARVTLHGPMEDLEIEASVILLATGRFLSGGLGSDRERVFEKLLDLPVVRPDSREGWHSAAYFDPRGHAINRFGVAVDDRFRPVDGDGAVVDERLFAVGALLAGQDWVRERSGAGVAIASAWAAVGAIGDSLRG